MPPKMPANAPNGEVSPPNIWPVIRFIISLKDWVARRPAKGPHQDSAAMRSKVTRAVLNSIMSRGRTTATSTMTRIAAKRNITMPPSVRGIPLFSMKFTRNSRPEDITMAKNSPRSTLSPWSRTAASAMKNKTRQRLTQESSKILFSIGWEGFWDVSKRTSPTTAPAGLSYGKFEQFLEGRGLLVGADHSQVQTLVGKDRLGHLLDLFRRDRLYHLYRLLRRMEGHVQDLLAAVEGRQFVRGLEPQYQPADHMVLGFLKLLRVHQALGHPPAFLEDHPDDLVHLAGIHARHHLQETVIQEKLRIGPDVVSGAHLAPDSHEKPGTHASAKYLREHLQGMAALVENVEGADAQDQVGLVGLLVFQEHAGRILLLDRFGLLRLIRGFQMAEELAHLALHLLLGEIPGHHHRGRGRHVMLGTIADEIIRGELHYHLLPARNIPAGRLVPVEQSEEILLHPPRGHVFIHIYLLDYHAPLFLYLFGIEHRVQVQIRDQIQDLGQLVILGFRPIAGVFLSGESVVFGAQRFQFLGDGSRLGAVHRAFERQMLQKMGQAVHFPGFVFRTGLHQGKHGRGKARLLGGQNHPQSVLECLALKHFDDPPKEVLARGDGPDVLFETLGAVHDRFAVGPQESLPIASGIILRRRPALLGDGRVRRSGILQV